MSQVDGRNATRRARRALSEEQLASPQQWWRELRESWPDANVDGCPAFVTRALALEVLHDTESFSSAGARETGSNDRALIPLEIDPPDHRRYRKLLDPIFAPRSIRTMEPAIRALVVETIEPIIARGECDFAVEISERIPSSFFLSLLGIPTSRLDEFLELKNLLLRTGADTEEFRERQRQAGIRGYQLFEAELAKRKVEPTDDLISQLLRAEIDGERLTDEEVLGTCFIFMLAGLDTTAAAIGSTVAYLAANPDDRRQLIDQPDLLPNAIEELLRHQTIVSNITRRITRDVVVDGRPLPGGTACVVALGAANTDPAVYERPEEVDFHREARSHLTFGGGIHRCLGSHLARAEIRLVLEEWHKRVADYQVAPGRRPVWADGPARSLDSLPLVWTTS